MKKWNIYEELIHFEVHFTYFRYIIYIPKKINIILVEK